MPNLVMVVIREALQSGSRLQSDVPTFAVSSDLMRSYDCPDRGSVRNTPNFCRHPVPAV